MELMLKLIVLHYSTQKVENYLNNFLKDKPFFSLTTKKAPLLQQVFHKDAVVQLFCMLFPSSQHHIRFKKKKPQTHHHQRLLLFFSLTSLTVYVFF